MTERQSFDKLPFLLRFAKEQVEFGRLHPRIEKLAIKIQARIDEVFDRPIFPEGYDKNLGIGFILDGNRRFAKSKGREKEEGHVAGKEIVVNTIISTILESGHFDHLFLYGFSTENWKRPQEEINSLMILYKEAIEELLPQTEEKGVKIIWAGRRDRVQKRNPKTARALENAEKETQENSNLTVYVGIDYGGEDDRQRAAKNSLDFPNMDILVRPGGEQRISGLGSQFAYSELFFLPKMLPELTKKDIRIILREFAYKDRRFGGGA